MTDGYGDEDLLEADEPADDLARDGQAEEPNELESQLHGRGWGELLSDLLADLPGKQKDVAAEAGLDSSYVSKLKSQSAAPPRDTVNRIGKALEKFGVRDALRRLQGVSAGEMRIEAPVAVFLDAEDFHGQYAEGTVPSARSIQILADLQGTPDQRFLVAYSQGDVGLTPLEATFNNDLKTEGFRISAVDSPEHLWRQLAIDLLDATANGVERFMFVSMPDDVSDLAEALSFRLKKRLIVTYAPNRPPNRLLACAQRQAVLPPARKHTLGMREAALVKHMQTTAPSRGNFYTFTQLAKDLSQCEVHHEAFRSETDARGFVNRCVEAGILVHSGDTAIQTRAGTAKVVELNLEDIGVRTFLLDPTTVESDRLSEP